MLQSIRNMLTGWVAVVFVALLIIPFAFWGIDSYFGSGARVNVARVNGVDISLAEYQRAYQNTRQQWQEISPMLAEQTEFLRQQTLDSLVDRLLVLELKDKLGLRLGDDHVRMAIYEIPVFRNPEGFDTVAYQIYLRSMGYTPSQFESQVREDMTLQQLQSGLFGTLIVTSAETAKLAALENERRDISYAQIPFDSVESGIEVTEAEAELYYQEHSEEFMLPEEARVAYIYLTIDSIARQISADEESLRDYFDSYRANYSVVERRKVRQILVYADADTSMPRAESVAREIYEQVAAGMTFAQAQERYDDGDISIEISDFGFLNPGVLDPEVNEVVFSIEQGVISEPIPSPYGYQLVMVEDITGGTVPNFEDVRDEVSRDYRREQAERRFFDLYDELAVLTYEHPDTLEVASELLDVPILESQSVTRAGASDPLLNNPGVISAVFSDDVLIGRNNSGLIELEPNRIMVLRIVEHTPARLAPFQEVRDEVFEIIQYEKGIEITRTIGAEIRAKLGQGIDKETLAEEYGIQWREESQIERDSFYLNGQILDAAFTAGRPTDETPVIGGVSLFDGGYAVIVVNAVHDLDPASLTKEDMEPIRDFIRQSAASKMWTYLIEDLRSRAEITIFDSNM